MSANSLVMPESKPKRDPSPIVFLEPTIFNSSEGRKISPDATYQAIVDIEMQICEKHGDKYITAKGKKYQVIGHKDGARVAFCHCVKCITTCEMKLVGQSQICEMINAHGLYKPSTADDQA